MSLSKTFSKAANAVAVATGRPAAFCLCVLIVVVWAVSGPIFKFSDTWQLVINTGTTIVTFLMVFLIQNTQNRETAAMQVKLDEIIYSMRGAQNRMIGIEHLTDEELEALVAEAEKRAAIPASQRTSRSFEGAAVQGNGRASAKPRKPAGKTTARRKSAARK